MSSIIISLYVISILVFNIFNVDYIYYMVIIAATYEYLSKYYKTHNDRNLIKLLICSAMIPSNYIVIGELILVSLILLKRKQLAFKKDIFSMVLIMYLILNIFINTIYPINIGFSVLYWSGLYLAANAINKLKINSDVDMDNIVDFIKKTIVLCGFSIVTYFLFNLDIVFSVIDFDWVTGTFGEYQGNIFYFYALFCFCVFLNRYLVFKKDKKYLLLSVCYMVLTGSIALIVFTGVSVLIYLFISKSFSINKKVRVVFVLCLAIIFFIIVTPTWIKVYMVRILNESDKSYYISKLNDYANVFLNQANSVQFDLFGCGIGNYSSRSALTCTGIYIDSYNRLFEPSISPYTAKYVFNKLVFVYENRLGTLDTPFSQYMSIKGELGLFGLFLLITYLVRLFRRSQKEAKVFMIFLILACFLENYLEFAKIDIFIYLAILLIRPQKIKDKNFSVSEGGS